MNTILTDDEISSMANRLEQQGDTMRQYARAVEAAVLAKLREQEPVAWMTHSADALPLFHKTKQGAEAWGTDAKPLYAAPLPAVVQVPPELKERICEAHDASLDEDHRACRSILMECVRLIDAAAPEAPAQVEAHKDRMQKVREFIQADSDLARGIATKTEAQAIPAPWREAVKVAREQMMTALAYMHEVCPYYPGDHRARDNAIKVIEAALAQLDALEGGE